MSTATYFEKFNNLVDVLEANGCGIGNDQGLIENELKGMNMNTLIATDHELKGAHKTARDKYLAITFLNGSNKNRFGHLIKNLENDT